MIETIGIIASLIILLSFLFTDLRKVRLINIFGAILYVIYGFFICSYANIILNGALILIHLYYLFVKDKKKGDNNG